MQQNEGQYLVTEAVVNRDPEQYRGTDLNHDAETLNFLIEYFLLGRRTSFPIPGDLPIDSPKGHYQHHISGSDRPEDKLKKKED